jgi:spore coat protein H
MTGESTLFYLKVGLLFGLSLVVSCRSLPMKEADSFGLPMIEIDVSSEDLAVLNSTVFEKTPVGADVKIGGKQTRVNLQYAGKSSLDDFKKNYDLKFRGDERYLGRKEVRVSSQSVDKSAMRAMLGFWAYSVSGMDASAIEPTSLYVNDEFRGLYFVLENVDEYFFKSRLIEYGQVYKAIFGNGNFGRETLRDPGMAFEVEEGDDDFGPIIRLSEIATGNDDPKVRIEALNKIVSAKAMLDYQATTVAINHFDGFSNNYLFFYDKGQGLYRPLPWDLDRIYEREPYPFNPGVTLWGSNNLTLLFLQDPANKKYFLEKLQSLLTGVLSKDAIYNKIDSIKSLIKMAWENDRVFTAKGRSIDAEEADLKDIIAIWHQQLLADVKNEINKINQ